MDRTKGLALFDALETEFNRIENQAQTLLDRITELTESHRLDREKWEQERKRLTVERDAKVHELIDSERKIEALERQRDAQREYIRQFDRGIPFKAVAIGFVLGAGLASLLILA